MKISVKNFLAVLPAASMDDIRSTLRCVRVDASGIYVACDGDVALAVEADKCFERSVSILPTQELKAHVRYLDKKKVSDFDFIIDENGDQIVDGKCFGVAADQEYYPDLRRLLTLEKPAIAERFVVFNPVDMKKVFDFFGKKRFFFCEIATEKALNESDEISKFTFRDREQRKIAVVFPIDRRHFRWEV